MADYSKYLSESLYSWDEIQDIIKNDLLLPNIGNTQGVLNVIQTMPNMDYRIKPLAGYIGELYRDNPRVIYDMEATFDSSLAAQKSSGSIANYVFDRVYHEYYRPDVETYREQDGFAKPESVSNILDKVVSDIKEAQEAKPSTSVFINNVSNNLIKTDKKNPDYKFLLVPSEEGPFGLLRLSKNQILQNKFDANRSNIILSDDRTYSVWVDKQRTDKTAFELLSAFEDSKAAYKERVASDFNISHRRLTPQVRKEFYGEVMDVVNEAGLTIAEYDKAVAPIIYERGTLDLENPDVIDEINAKSTDKFNLDLVKAVEDAARESFFMTPRESGFMFNPQECVVEGCEVTEDNFKEVPASLSQFDLSPAWADDGYKELDFYLNNSSLYSDGRSDLANYDIYLNDTGKGVSDYDDDLDF